MTSPLSKAAIGKRPVVPFAVLRNMTGNVPSANSVNLSTAPQRASPPRTAPTYANPYYPVIGNGYAMIDDMDLPSNAVQHFNGNGQMAPHVEFSPFGDANWAALTFGNDGVLPHISEPENLECENQSAPAFAKICKWEGCKYTGSFGRGADLLRHVQTAHISPRSFVCSVSGCRKSCSRKDNLEAHYRRVHQNSK